jgi:hypothetical protein
MAPTAPHVGINAPDLYWQFSRRCIKPALGSKLAKVLSMLGSACDGEITAARHRACALVKGSASLKMMVIEQVLPHSAALEDNVVHPLGADLFPPSLCPVPGGRDG